MRRYHQLIYWGKLGKSNLCLREFTNTLKPVEAAVPAVLPAAVRHYLLHSARGDGAVITLRLYNLVETEHAPHCHEG